MNAEEALDTAKKVYVVVSAMFEHRALRENERPQNMIVEFVPDGLAQFVPPDQPAQPRADEG